MWASGCAPNVGDGVGGVVAQCFVCVAKLFVVCHVVFVELVGCVVEFVLAFLVAPM